MKVGKLLHTRYRVNDLERTVKFYRDVLGLEEIRRQFFISRVAFLRHDGTDLWANDVKRANAPCNFCFSMT